MYFINSFKGLRPTEKESSTVAIASTDHLSKEVIAKHRKNTINISNNYIYKIELF